MKPYSFIRASIVVLLAWLTLLGWAVSHTAAASVEFQLIQSLGKRDGTPYGKLVRDTAGNLYGTTSDGGSNAAGTIFKLKPSGEITVLHEFDGAGGGANPSGLIQGNDGSFYGTTAYTSNGGNGDGTVFKLDASGNFSVLHSFDGSGAAYPTPGLVQGSDGGLYGTFTFLGSYAFYGGVFKIDAAGIFSVLHSFDGNDGGGPYTGLIQGSDGDFYGATGYGGSYGAGTVFKIDASGNFSVLYEFDGSGGGAYPSSGLVQSSDGSFYGTTSGVGSANSGTIFKFDPTGNFSILYSFDYTSKSGTNPFGLIQGSDGLFYGFTTISEDSNGLAVFKFDASSGHFNVLHSFDVISDAEIFQGSDGSFYGTTSRGGSNGTGMVFKLDPSGSFSVIHSFDGIDGANPYSGLIQSKDGSFYGTTSYGGSYGAGTVFKIDASGNFSVLHEFDVNDGYGPYASLVQGSDDSFYGTASSGGSNNAGTLFKLDPSNHFSILYEFDGAGSGERPNARLIEGSDGSFYGTAYYGGSYGNGTLFKLDPLSNHMTVLHEFDGTNGANPNAGVIQASDGNFYGTTVSGGSNAVGTVFKLDPSGNFTVLHEFDTAGGAYPYSELIQDNDGHLYGTTALGGSNDYGTVFKIDSTGDFRVLHEFNGTNGIGPSAGVIEANDGSFYGTTTNGGNNNLGTVFKLNPSGNFSILHSFDERSNEGAYPNGLIQANDGNFYGTTLAGGQYDGGVIYRLIETPDAAPIVLESSANPSLRGQRVTFTAMVIGNNPTGSVRFLKGAKSLGSVPLIDGVARLSTSRLKIGSHSITAVYSGDANNASVTSSPIVQVVKAVTKKELRARPRGTLGWNGR